MPALANLLNRLFIISRDEFQNIWGLSGIAGSFIIFVVYLNYAEEKNTILGKNYAISLTSLLVILQFVNHFIVKEKERIFDQIKSKENFELIFTFFYKKIGITKLKS